MILYYGKWVQALGQRFPGWFAVADTEEGPGVPAPLFLDETNPYLRVWMTAPPLPPHLPLNSRSESGTGLGGNNRQPEA